MRVLHVIQILSRGGAGRAFLAAAASTAGGRAVHEVASLIPADPAMVAATERRGIRVLNAPPRDRLLDRIAAADLVQLHFWNTPELYDLLFDELPPMRLLVWSHVAGEVAPQVLTAELVEYADHVVATSPHPAADRVITAVPGWDRLSPMPARRDRRFTVGYVGTIDFSKMHPAYASMSLAVDVPDVRFVVCGIGGALAGLKHDVAQAGARDRFEFRGFVEDIGAALAEMDVFGYPLSDENSTTSELVLQEAMYARVPPVVFPHGWAQHAVAHGETGLVVETPADYTRAIEFLYENPDERRRLGENARRQARSLWSPEGVGPLWSDAYAAVMDRPKHKRSWPSSPPASGAVRFVHSLDGFAPHFRVSLGSTGDEVFEAERRIAASPPLMCTGGGGILAYRDRYPDDPHLRLWSGLVLYRHRHLALAAGELSRAIELGCDDWRVHWYLAETARALGEESLMEQALRAVPLPVPDMAEQVLAADRKAVVS